MAATSIEWSDAVWNPTTGCSYASEGCRNCYAFTMTKRLAAMGQVKYQGLAAKGHFNGVLKTHDDELEKPLRWRKPRMVFVNSMSDLFHPNVPFEFVHKVYVVMECSKRHTYQILTKRPERRVEFYEWERERASDEVDCVNLPLPNVWEGTSVENQAAADERVPHLLRCPAAVRFISAEPLLGPVNLTEIGETTVGITRTNGKHYPLLRYNALEGREDPHCESGNKIHWVIVGGESGHGARPCDLNWIEDIALQCRSAKVPLFIKQLGSNPVSLGGPIPKLRDRKGGDPAEWPWPAIREFPQPAKE